MHYQRLSHSLLRFLDFSEIQQHAGVHPVNARSRGIEFQTASVCPLSKVIEPGIVVSVTEQIPCELRIWPPHGSLSQPANGLRIPPPLCQSETQGKQTLGGIRIQLEGAACCLFPLHQVARRVLTKVCGLEQVQHCQQCMCVCKRRVYIQCPVQGFLSPSQVVQLCAGEIV